MDKGQVRDKFMEGYHCPDIKEGISIMRYTLENFFLLEKKNASRHYEALDHFLSVYTKENGMMLGMIWEAFNKLMKESTMYSFVGNDEFPRYFQKDIPEISKGEAFSKLSKEKYEYDFALPQFWLDEFVKESGLEYHLILSTTVWVYERGSFRSGAVSICVEVQRALEKYFYKEN